MSQNSRKETRGNGSPFNVFKKGTPVATIRNTHILIVSLFDCHARVLHVEIENYCNFYILSILWRHNYEILKYLQDKMGCKIKTH